MFTASIDIVKQLNARNSFFYGFEGIYNDVVSTANLQNFITGETAKTSTRYPDGSNDYRTYAAYINYEYFFTKPFTLFAGIRYSYVNLNSTFADTSLFSFPYDEVKINTGAFNGSVGISWNPGNGWQSKVNLSSGFRAPNLDDVGKVFDSSPGNVVVPNPELQPEYSYSLDATLRKEFSEILVLELSGFYNYLIDAMVRRDFSFNGQDSIWYDGTFSNVEALVNAGSASIYGISAMGRIQLGPYFDLSSAINWMRGEDDEGNAMRHVSPIYGNTTIRFKNSRFIAELYANYNGEIPFARLAPSERDKPHIYATDENGNPYAPSWWTLNFKSTLSIVDQLSIDIGVENIFSERYRPYSSGIVAPGRNFILAVRAQL
jgi:hemoglobin/transferrin/lactoferrin receptor protein